MVFYGILKIGGVSGRVTPVQLYEYEDQWGLAHYEDQWGLAFERPYDSCLSGTLFTSRGAVKSGMGIVRGWSPVQSRALYTPIE